MRRFLRPALLELATAAAVVIGIVLLAVAGDVYASHVTGVYQDRCDAGWYGAYRGPDQRHACYPTSLEGLYVLAWAASVLLALGSAASCARSLRRLTRAPGWELGVRGTVFLLAAPVIAYRTLWLLFRGMAQAVWRSGCWICPTATPLTAPDPSPAFDVANWTLAAAALASLGLALVMLVGAAVRGLQLARRAGRAS